MPHTDAIPASASIASTGTGIRYIGDWAYAYSGTFASLSSVTVMLDFTSGSGYVTGDLVVNSAIDFSVANINAGVATGYQLSFNDIVISIIKVEGGTEDAPSYATQPVLIPPFTAVKLERVASANNSSFLDTAHFIGRVYGAE